MFIGILSILIWVTALINVIDAISLQDQFVQNNTTSSYLNETVLCVKDVLIPQEIKEKYEPPQWLNSWEDIEFSTTCDEDEDAQYSDQIDSKVKQLAYNYASGKYVEDWNNLVNKRDVNSELDYFWNTGNLKSDHKLNKRYRWAWNRAAKWIKSNSHKAKSGALNVLAGAIGTCGSATWGTSRSAICKKDGNNRACCSWSGGGHGFLCHAAADLISDARGYFGEFGDLSCHASNAFLDNHVKHSFCISDRPTGCN